LYFEPNNQYIFSVPEWNKPVAPGDERRTYVLSGSNVCGDDEGSPTGHWCGYGKGRPQSLLFSSTNLVDWRFENVFWQGGTSDKPGQHLSGGGSLYTPDTFALADGSGRQMLIYLRKGTQWSIGHFNKSNGTFVQDAGPGNSGSERSLGSCGQSLTDAKGRRVQFGWQHLGIEGALYTGAQSLPRVITVTGNHSGSSTGVRFAPLPELAILHDLSTHKAGNLTLSPSTPPSPSSYTFLPGITKAVGLYHHMQLVIKLNSTGSSSFTVCVQCGPGDSGVEASVQGTADGAVDVILGDQPGMQLYPSSSGSSPISTVFVDVFVDGALIEIFVNDGEQTSYTARPSVSSFGIGMKVTGSQPVLVGYELWRMNQSVF
jgi:sucrose-6-phosphate hydrolase SacC (GH32 family)